MILSAYDDDFVTGVAVPLLIGIIESTGCKITYKDKFERIAEVLHYYPAHIEIKFDIAGGYNEKALEQAFKFEDDFKGNGFMPTEDSLCQSFGTLGGYRKVMSVSLRQPHLERFRLAVVTSQYSEDEARSFTAENYGRLSASPRNATPYVQAARELGADIVAASAERFAAVTEVDFQGDIVEVHLRWAVESQTGFSASDMQSVREVAKQTLLLLGLNDGDDVQEQGFARSKNPQTRRHVLTLGLAFPVPQVKAIAKRVKEHVAKRISESTARELDWRPATVTSEDVAAQFGRYGAGPGANIVPIEQLYGMQVNVFRNLNNGRWSIKQKGLVRAYADVVFVKDCVFPVGKAASARIRAGENKSVHAYVRGVLLPHADMINPQCINYNPHLSDHFYPCADPATELVSAKLVKLDVNAKPKVVAEGLELKKHVTLAGYGVHRRAAKPGYDFADGY